MANIRSSLDSSVSALVAREWISPEGTDELRERKEVRKLPKDQEEEADKDDQHELPSPLVDSIASDDLLKKLDLLWDLELLQMALEQVDTSVNSALDSLIMEQIESVEDQGSDVNGLEDALEKASEIPKEGEQRMEKAKEAAASLQELLALEMADAMSLNVERIKRLLTRSLLASVLAERLEGKQLLSSQLRALKEITGVSKTILDTVQTLMVHDEKLGAYLVKASTNLYEVLKGIETEVLEVAYEQYRAELVFRLNDLDVLLYDILQSEKQALAAQQKACKKGKPGTSGKPSTGQGAKSGPKGSRPGGRRMGRQGEPSTEPGSQAGGQVPNKLEQIKEGLSRLDALSKQVGEGTALAEELERLKRELLLSGQTEGEELEMDWENKLWRLEEAVYSSDREQGNSRKSNSGAPLPNDEPNELSPWILDRDEDLQLPLPVLKSKTK